MRAKAMRPVAVGAGMLLLLGTLSAASAELSFELASVGSREQVGNENSRAPEMSADGRYVFFFSLATNFGKTDWSIFRRGLDNGRTALVSRTSRGAPVQGAEVPAVSPNGRFLAFCSTDPNIVKPDELFFSGAAAPLQYMDVFVRDLRRGVTRRASSDFRGGMSNHFSCYPSVSNHGDVAFESQASDLVRGDTNDKNDVFLWGWRTGKTRRVSVSSSGKQGDRGSSLPAISGNGRVVGFRSGATNLVKSDDLARPRYLHLTASRRTITLPAVPGMTACSIGTDSISSDGRYIAVGCQRSFTNVEGSHEVEYYSYRFDRKSRTYELATPTAHMGGLSETMSELHMSADGRYLSFCTFESTLVAGDDNHEADAFVRDLELDTTTRVTERDADDFGAGVRCETAVSTTGVVAFATHIPFVAHDDNDAIDVYVART